MTISFEKQWLPGSVPAAPLMSDQVSGGLRGSDPETAQAQFAEIEWELCP